MALNVSPLLGIGLAILGYWRGWVFPRTGEWAPVNITAAQLAKALKRAEAKVESLGCRLGQRHSGRSRPGRRDDIGGEEGGGQGS